MIMFCISLLVLLFDWFIVWIQFGFLRMFVEVCFNCCDFVFWWFVWLLFDFIRDYVVLMVDCFLFIFCYCLSESFYFIGFCFVWCLFWFDVWVAWLVDNWMSVFPDLVCLVVDWLGIYFMRLCFLPNKVVVFFWWFGVGCCCF